MAKTSRIARSKVSTYGRLYNLFLASADYARGTTSPVS
jgi:hypothetical protein